MRNADRYQRNYPLLRKTLEHIEQHPEEHEQDVWGKQTPCGTSFCFAGHALNIGGAKLSWGEKPNWWDLCHPDKAYIPDMDGAILPGQTDILDPHSAARELLGLSEAEASHLFWAGRTIKGIRTFVNKILAER